MTRRILPCLLVVLAATAGGCEDGGPPDLAPGLRVRVTAPAVAREPMTGTVGALSDDAITLAVEGRDQRIPRGSIVRIEASQGRNRRKGLLIGGFAAAAAGAVVGGIGCRDSADFDSSSCAAILGGFGFAAGAGVGALVGAGEHWKDLPSGRVHVSVSPTAAGLPGLSVRIEF